MTQKAGRLAHTGVGKAGKATTGAGMKGPSGTSGNGEKFINNIIPQPFMQMSDQDAGAGSQRNSAEYEDNARTWTNRPHRPLDGVGSAGGRNR
jgi:hypothetical protein